MECTTEPGDVIFVPRGWWHMAVNLDESVAVTQNYVCESALAFVRRFLKHEAHNISGVRDDEAAARLGGRFDAVLVEKGFVGGGDGCDPSGGGGGGGGGAGVAGIFAAMDVERAPAAEGAKAAGGGAGGAGGFQFGFALA